MEAAEGTHICCISSVVAVLGASAQLELVSGDIEGIVHSKAVGVSVESGCCFRLCEGNEILGSSRNQWFVKLCGRWKHRW